MDDMTLQQYINMYKKPLNENSMEAILQLTEVAVEKNKKKSKASRTSKTTKTKKREANQKGIELMVEEAYGDSKITKKEKRKGLIREISHAKKKKKAPACASA
jgi:hypothetical protein